MCRQMFMYHQALTLDNRECLAPGPGEFSKQRAKEPPLSRGLDIS